MTITCARTNATHPEWKFLLSDGDRYLYTQNIIAIRNMGFDFNDSGSATHGLLDFSVTISVDTNKNNMKIRCALKDTEGSDPICNTFENIIIVKKG